MSCKEYGQKMKPTVKAMEKHKEGKMIDGMKIEVKNVTGIVYDAKDEYVTLLLGSDFKKYQDKHKEIPVNEELNINIVDANTVIITEDYE